jgi:hypothetical protein
VILVRPRLPTRETFASVSTSESGARAMRHSRFLLLLLVVVACTACTGPGMRDVSGGEIQYSDFSFLPLAPDARGNLCEIVRVSVPIPGPDGTIGASRVAESESFPIADVVSDPWSAHPDAVCTLTPIANGLLVQQFRRMHVALPGACLKDQGNVFPVQPPCDMEGWRICKRSPIGKGGMPHISGTVIPCALSASNPDCVKYPQGQWTPCGTTGPNGCKPCLLGGGDRAELVRSSVQRRTHAP